MRVYNCSGKDLWIDNNYVKKDLIARIKPKDLDILDIDGNVIGRLDNHYTPHYILYSENDKPVITTLYELSLKRNYYVCRGECFTPSVHWLEDDDAIISTVVDGKTIAQFTPIPEDKLIVYGPIILNFLILFLSLIIIGSLFTYYRNNIVVYTNNDQVLYSLQ